MSEYYLTRPRRVTVEHWESPKTPPGSVHDQFWNADGGVQSGYVTTHDGERIVQVGQYVVTYEDTSERVVLDLTDLRDGFVRVVEE